MSKERGYIKLATDVDASVDFVTEWAVVTAFDSAMVGINWDSSDLLGTVYVDLAVADTTSNVNQPNFLGELIYDDITSYSLDASGTATQYLFNLTDIGAMLMRIRYVADVATPGTGTITARAFLKSKGS
jgi:hypothetical protein